MLSWAPLISLAVALARALDVNSTRSLATAEVPVTLNGCTCKKSWEETGIGSCANYCCNPDNDPLGIWCQVVDSACEDSDWGYCASETTAVSTTPGCVDVVGWRDTDGDGCTRYLGNQWCTTSGQAGPGWHSDDWGDISSFTANGYTALTACCGCGGGSTGSSTTASQDRYTFTGCKCKKNWDESTLLNREAKCDNWCCNPDSDPAGEWCQVEDFSCEDSDWGYCRPWGSGATTPTFNYSTQHGHCSDTANWKDVDGESCVDYASKAYCTDVGGYGLGWNMEWGTFESFALGSDGAADDACCACGGGSRDEFDYYYLMYFYYYSMPNEDKQRTTWTGCLCQEHWEDPSGHKCDDFCCNVDNNAVGDWCKVQDLTCEGADWGYCQDSGLGTIARPLQDAAHCSDVKIGVAGWADKDGDSCSVYAGSMWCTANGGVGVGWHADWGNMSSFEIAGHTALTACCACGGGNRQVSTPRANPVDSLKEAVYGSADHMWKVTSGPCKMDDDGCITSGNYPQPYGAQEQCQISVTPAKAVPIHVVSFDTEVSYDSLMVNGREFSGQRGPQGLLPTGTIHWGVDGQDQKPGWKICPRGEELEDSSAQVLAISGIWAIFVLIACCCCVIIGCYMRVERAKPHGDGLGAGPVKVGRRYASQEDEC